MFHHRAFAQRLPKTRKLRRGTPTPWRMPNVIANKPNRESAPPCRPAHTTRRMQRQHVKAHHITGLKRPPNDRIRPPITLNIRQIHQAALRNHLA